MSVYAVDTLCHRVVHEPELRNALSADDPGTALREARPPLSDDEIAALVRGDVGWLSRQGANSFLLHQLGRWELFGLDLNVYGERIRAEYAVERAAAGEGGP